jgi:hypothetical protein
MSIKIYAEIKCHWKTKTEKVEIPEPASVLLSHSNDNLWKYE